MPSHFSCGLHLLLPPPTTGPLASLCHCPSATTMICSKLHRRPLLLALWHHPTTKGLTIGVLGPTTVSQLVWTPCSAIQTKQPVSNTYKLLQSLFAKDALDKVAILDISQSKLRSVM